MFRVEESILINKPVQEVFAFASDWNRWHEWFEGVSPFIPTTEIKQGNGARYAYKARLMGMKFPVETEIHDYAENKGWKGKSTKGPPHLTRWRFESTGTGTRFTYGLEGRLPIPLLGPFIDSRLLQPQWKKIIGNSLLNLKLRMETR